MELRGALKAIHPGMLERFLESMHTALQIHVTDPCRKNAPAAWFVSGSIRVAGCILFVITPP